MKRAGDHLTNQCHRKDRLSDVRFVLLQGQETYTRLRLKHHIPPAQIKQALHTQPGVTSQSQSHVTTDG
jgi:hypothetical protein